MRPVFTLPSPFLLLVLLSTSGTLASVGVVDIDTLLHTKDQQPIVSSDTQHDALWSHDPFCIRSTRLPTVGKKFCIYTSNMTGPTGISLILTPRKAAEAADYLDDNPINNFLTAAQAESLYLSDPPYKVVDMEGKGKGVIATRKIKKFETVIVDQAAVVEDMGVEAAASDGEHRSLLGRAVGQLRRPAVVRALSARHAGHKEGDSGGETEDEEGRLEEDIMLTNAFGSDIVGIKCRALYPLVSVSLLCMGMKYGL